MTDVINKKLQETIKRECMIKSATKKAQDDYIERQNDARHAIEDLKELAKVEQDYLDYE